jgi:hypothetical protein
MKLTEANKLKPGFYRIFWNKGSSLAAIGVSIDGTRWLAPINWVSPTTDSTWWRRVKAAVYIEPPPKIKVNIIESEAGWGRKVDETKEFDTLEEAEKFVEKYNAPNVMDWNKTQRVPSCYWQAEIVK